MTLFEVRGEQTRNESLADPEMAALIEPIASAQTKALAVYARKTWTRYGLVE